MPADTLEAPSTAHDVFKSVETFETPTPRAVTPEPSTTTGTGNSATVMKPDAGTTTQVLEDKPDAMKAQPGEKKGPLDKLGQVKKPEVAKVEPKPAATPAVEEKPVDTRDPKLLREAYAKSQSDMAALRAELDKVRPDAEKVVELRTELEGSRTELAKLKALQLNDEERKRFDGLRELHARYEVENSQDYQQKIMGPIHQRIAKIDKVAKDAKLDPVATTALKDAMDMPDELDRNRAIRQILRGVELEGDDFADYYQSMTSVGKELNEQYYPQMEAKLRSAGDIEEAARVKAKQQTEETSIREKAEYQKEHENIYKLLTEGTFKPLMEDTDLSVDGTTLTEALKNAEVAETPHDRAAQAQVFAAAPFLVVKLNKALQQIHDLEQANKVRNGSAPSRNDALVKTNAAQPSTLDANTVFKSGQSFGP